MRGAVGVGATDRGRRFRGQHSIAKDVFVAVVNRVGYEGTEKSIRGIGFFWGNSFGLIPRAPAAGGLFERQEEILGRRLSRKKSGSTGGTVLFFGIGELMRLVGYAEVAGGRVRQSSQLELTV